MVESTINPLTTCHLASSQSIQLIRTGRVLGALLDKRKRNKNSGVGRYVDRTCCHPKSSESLSQSPQVNGVKEL